MKTPREILLEQHRAAESKLDALRQKALNIVADDKQGARRKRKIFNPLKLPSLVWRELILVYPRVWSGLAAIWLVIFALQFASRDASPAIAKNSPPPSPEMLAAIQNQKRLLAEMLQDGVKANDTDRPKPSRPPPHSELSMPFVTT